MGLELKYLSLNIKDGILTITICREDKLNALNQKVLEELKYIMQKAYDDDDIQGIIITGKGEKSFVAGADIAEIANLGELNSRKYSENGQEIFAMIENCYKPVIAAVNGFALGGGCELAMACHIRIAVKTAKFGQPEVKLGTIPGYGGTQRLPQLIGKGKALELLITGEMINAEKSLEIGLINYIAEDITDLYNKSKDLLHKILKNSPNAIGMVIQCVNAAYNNQEDGYQTESKYFGISSKSEDYKEGMKAFLENKPPNFTGR